MKFKKALLFSFFSFSTFLSMANAETIVVKNTDSSIKKDHMLNVDFDIVDLSSHIINNNKDKSIIPYISLKINRPLKEIFNNAESNLINISAYLNNTTKLDFNNCTVDLVSTNYNLPFYYHPSILHSKIIKCKNKDNFILDFIIAERDYITEKDMSPDYNMSYEIISPYYKPFYGEKDNPITSVYNKPKFEIRKEFSHYGIELNSFFEDKGLLFY